jgi:hypothetical protein
MQNESATEVKAEDKLRWLSRLDGGRGWEFAGRSPLLSLLRQDF